MAGAFEAMRQALRQALIERWRIERERREMVAAITHDLRTPLSVIRGTCSIPCWAGRIAWADRLERYLQTIRLMLSVLSHLVQEMSQLVEVDHPGFSLTALPTSSWYFRVKADEYRLSVASAGIVFDAAVRGPRAGTMAGSTSMSAASIRSLPTSLKTAYGTHRLEAR